MSLGLILPLMQATALCQMGAKHCQWRLDSTPAPVNGNPPMEINGILVQAPKSMGNSDGAGFGAQAAPLQVNIQGTKPWRIWKGLCV